MAYVPPCRAGIAAAASWMPSSIGIGEKRITRAVAKVRPPLQVQPKSRVIIVGDVHGHVEALRQIVSRTGYVPGTDKLIICGDLVNKGPDSVGVVRYAMSLGAECVMGNHEWALLYAADDIASGRLGDCERYAGPIHRLAREFLGTEENRECLTFLKTLPHIIDIPQVQVAVVHAGIDPKKPLSEQKAGDVMFLKLDEWAEGLDAMPDPRLVVHGHDARSREPIQGPRRLGLDTGCATGGPLTAYVFTVSDDGTTRSDERFVRADAGAPIVDQEDNVIWVLDEAINEAQLNALKDRIADRLQRFPDEVAIWFVKSLIHPKELLPDALKGVKGTAEEAAGQYHRSMKSFEGRSMVSTRKYEVDAEVLVIILSREQ